MRIPLLISVLLLLFSCQDIKKKEQLEKVKKLQTRIEKVEQAFLKNKNDSIGKIVQSIMDVEFRIRRNYFSDTINKDLGYKVNAYKGVRKTLKGIGKYYGQIPTGVKEEKQSLENLYSDIEQTAGDKSKYDEYISFEEKKVKQLETTVQEMIKGQNECLNTYRKYHQELYDFSMSLLSKKKVKS